MENRVRMAVGTQEISLGAGGREGGNLHVAELLEKATRPG